MRFAHRLILGAVLLHKSIPALLAQKAGRHRNRAAGIKYMYYWLAIVWRDLDRSVRTAGRRSTDEQRLLETLPFHLAGNVHHLVERRSNQPTEADDVRLHLFGPFKNLLR